MGQFDVYRPDPLLLEEVTESDLAIARTGLETAYRQGMVLREDYEERLDMLNRATTRGHVDTALAGLTHGSTMHPRSASTAMEPSMYQTRMESRPVPIQKVQRVADKGMGAFAHWSIFFSWIIGPGLIHATAPVGSWARKQAARSFNWQITWLVLTVILGLVTDIFMPEWLQALIMAPWALAWLVFTIMGAAKAGQGIDWKNPIMEHVHIDVLDED